MQLYCDVASSSYIYVRTSQPLPAAKRGQLQLTTRAGHWIHRSVKQRILNPNAPAQMVSMHTNKMVLTYHACIHDSDKYEWMLKYEKGYVT